MVDTPHGGDGGTRRRNADDLYAELTRQDQIVQGMSERVDNVEHKVDAVIAKLDQVASALILQQARPTISLNNLLQNIVYGATLVGAAVAAIVYVSGNNFAVEMNAAKTQMAAIAERSYLYHDEVQRQIRDAQANADSRMVQHRERIINLEKYLMNRPGGLESQLYVPPDDTPYRPPVPRLNGGHKDERDL